MQLGPFVEALRRDLESVVSTGDAGTQEVARRMAGALEAAIRLRFLEALSQAAHELAPQLPGGRVEVRLAGSEPAMTFVEDTPAAAVSGGEEGLAARVTLRLTARLKTEVEQAASREAMSVNTWINHALTRASERSTRGGPGRRLTGFARS